MLNKHKHNIKKPYQSNIRLPLRMVVYKTVTREKLTQYSKQDTIKEHNRPYADIDVDDALDAVNTVNSIQDNHNNKQENINFKFSKSSEVYKMFNKHVQNKSNFQFENIISKNHSIVLEENKDIKKINVYNAVDLIKINNDELYYQTQSEINHVLFDLNETSSEENTLKLQNEHFNKSLTFKENNNYNNTSITSALQQEQFFNNTNFMNGLSLLEICDGTDLFTKKYIN